MTMVIRFIIRGLYLVGSVESAATSAQLYALEIIFFFGKRLLFDYRTLALFLRQLSKN